MRLTEQLRDYINAAFSGLWIQTVEPEHFEILPDPSRLFVLHFNGDPLADGSSKIVLRPDSTLTSVDLTSTSEGASVLDAFSTGITSLNNEISAEKKAGVGDDADFVTNCDELRKAEALKAELPSTATTSQVIDAQLAIDKAKSTILKMFKDPNACPQLP